MAVSYIILQILISANENSIHIYCICYPSNYFGFKFYKPVSFSFSFLIDHGDEYDTIKYKYQIKMKNFRTKIIVLKTITYALIMPMLNIYHMRGG